MNLIGITINHKTAPIELREALHLNNDEIAELIPKLQREIFSEGFILSTCNRTEIFGFPHSYKINFRDVQEFIINHKKVEGLEPKHFRNYFVCGAVKHIFSVTSGVDSLMIGDSQILGQAKEAFQIADDKKFVGSIMRRLCDTAIKVGKRSIKETLIGEGAVSVSYAAVQVVEKIFANLEKKSALVIGAGETGELAAVHLRDKGVGNIAISNRTISKAERLGKKVHGEIIPFEHIKEHLQNYDIVISATSSENVIIGKDDIKKMMKKRKGTPVCLMDIAIPRDIDPAAKKMDNVFYHDIDSLTVIVDQNLKKRKDEIPAVEKIIMEEMVGFFSWYNTLEVVPTIKQMRDFFEEIRRDELDKIKHKITQEDYDKLEDMTRRMMGRLLHNPTVKLRELAESGENLQEATNNSYIVQELFGLSKNGKDKNHL